MSFAPMQTPQRPLPGAFLQTPAASRYQPGPDPARNLFRQPPQASQTNPTGQAQGTSAGSQQQQVAQTQTQPRALLPVQRAARTINEVLQRDANFPDLDSYVRQGISSDYDLPSPSMDASWAPYEKTRMYPIPDTIYEQFNLSQVNTAMGLFAELNHAWVYIDNALYLWDYTQTNPEIVGYEEQPNSITAVKLIVPKAGVFTSAITHLLVVATTLDIQLIGVSASQGPTGARTVSLYATGMSQSIKGITVNKIEGSRSNGRIFFAGMDNDVYELTYQQEERWFANRCSKINHTSPAYTTLLPVTPFALGGRRSTERIVEMVVDDTRNLLYTLSTESAIRTFHMDSPTTLALAVTKSRLEILRDISHMIGQTPLLTNSIKIVSINTIPSSEAAKLHLMAVTSTGCRLFLSATRGYGSLAGRGEAPTSMQVQHIKFPPREQSQPQARPNGQFGQATSYQGAGADAAIDTQSRALELSREGHRFPPGLFLCYVSRQENRDNDVLFLSAPDTGRIAYAAREVSAQGTKFYEQGLWMSFDSHVEDIGLVTKPFGARSTPLGFGNELAVQFDDPSPEIALLTNTGVHTIRRRRLVDIFCAAIRYGTGEEGLEGEMRRFIRRYGRGEVTAAALAVACGQSVDISSADQRATKVTDPAALELARKAFVEHGGRPSINENTVSDATTQAIDHVRPSARHEGLALYMTRVVRSVWKAAVITQAVLPTGAMAISSTVSGAKLRLVQEDLSKLDAFLEKNSSFIEGLSGPEGLHRVASKQEEIALQGEHQALYSLKMLNKSIIEGISFVLMLFDERVDELWISLDDTTKQRLRDLTYESLFASDNGKDLGKVLVKAIVNRNIANGSNVDTVADALRRKCSSFCSADDVLIFKAQEQLKKASELGPNTDLGRNVLNESLRLFNRVAGSLTPEYLQTAVNQYVALQFYAGAIQLSLNVAAELDRGNRALNWINDGKPENDPRAALYERRKRCYELVHQIIEAVDTFSAQQPEMIDGRYTVAATKKYEAHNIINESDDEVFQYDLYDWYLAQGWDDKVLAVNSEYVIKYLQRLSGTKVAHADLLWRFYAHKERFYDAANVQLQLAKSEFPLTLKTRIEYLSMAKANASTHSVGIGRQARQILLHEITELLEVANIQDDILIRLRGDPRLPEERKPEVILQLDGPVLGLTDLYNQFADQANYFGICLLIYQAADHRNPADVFATWENLIEHEHSTIEDQGERANQHPYEHIITTVTDLAHRLNLSETIFPPNMIIPLLESYACLRQAGVGSPNWVIDLFIDVGMPYESIYSTLETIFYNSEAPFTGRNRNIIAMHMVYTIKKWFEDCLRKNQRIFGGDDNAATISNTLSMLTQNGLNREQVEEAQDLRRSIERMFR